MSNRERWIIYPLLFLSLGASIRTHVFPVFDQLYAGDLRVQNVKTTNRISCRTLEVTESILLRGADGKARIVLSDASNRSGQIHILGQDGKSVIAMGASKKSGSGEIAVFDGAGEIRVRMASVQGGGALATFGTEGKPLVFLEHNGKDTGTVVRYDREGHRYGMLGLRLPDPPPPAEEVVDPATTNADSASEKEATTEEANDQPSSDDPSAPEGE